MFEPFVRSYFEHFKFSTVSHSQFKEYLTFYFIGNAALKTVSRGCGLQCRSGVLFAIETKFPASLAHPGSGGVQYSALLQLARFFQLGLTVGGCAGITHHPRPS